MLPIIGHTLVVYKSWYGFRDNFPRKSRYTLADKIDSRFINLLELLQMASYQNTADKLPTLARALTALDTIKFLLKISWEIKALDNKKYELLSEKLNEIGRELGGWRKGIQRKTSLI